MDEPTDKMVKVRARVLDRYADYLVAALKQLRHTRNPSAKANISHVEKELRIMADRKEWVPNV